MRSEYRYFMLYSVCAILLTLAIAYSITSRPPSPPEPPKDDEVSGIVIRREGASVWLRLTTPDQMNNIDAGEITAYRILDKYAEDFDVGDLLSGKLLGNKTILHEPGTPFFVQDFDYGFVNRGDLLLFGGGAIRQLVSNPYPVLRFSIVNLGEKEVIAVRAKINEYLLPYTFGVSEDSPIKPSKNEYMDRYTAWYDPAIGGVSGYVPVDGEEYTVEVTVKLDDYSTQVFNRIGIFEMEKGYAIATVVGSERVFFREPDLLSYGLSGGGSVSLNFRNVWRVGSFQVINRLQLYLDEIKLCDEEILVDGCDYFSVTVHVPFDLVPRKSYDVTLVAQSTTGLNSTYTILTKCQYYRIR